MNPYESIESFIFKTCTKAIPFDNSFVFFRKNMNPLHLCFMKIYLM